jgi:hypothetical protein
MVSLIKIIIRVPEFEKDRRTRPYDRNSGIVKIRGTLKYTDMNIHKIKNHENNHNLNVFVNNSPEDLLHFWDVKNIGNSTNVYFQEIDYFQDSNKDIFPVKLTVQETINNQLIEDKIAPYYKSQKASFAVLLISAFGVITCI